MRSFPPENWPTSRSFFPSPFQSSTTGAACPVSTLMGSPPASIFTGVYPWQHRVTVGLHAETKKARSATLEINRIPSALETVQQYEAERV